MDNPAASQRYYAMDALRSSMMLLGIVLHAALPYTTSISGRSSRTRIRVRDANGRAIPAT
jgi:hypothetical protein